MDYTSLPTQEVPSALLGMFAVGLPFIISIFFIVWLAFVVLMITSAWHVYTKAGKPGWAAIIPIYNIIVLLEIVERPIWWLLLLLIPIVNVVVSIILVHKLAVAFGHGVGFTLGLLFLSPIFYPILAFGKSVYMPVTSASVSPVSTMAASVMPPTTLAQSQVSLAVPTPPHKSHAWIWILVILLVLALLAAGAWGVYSSYRSYSEKYKNLQFDNLTEPSTPLSNSTPEDIEAVSQMPAPVVTPTSTVATSMPAPAPAKTWHQVATFSDTSTGISGSGNSSEFSIKGSSFRLVWIATPGKYPTISISANGVANHSYGCDFLNIPVAPGSGTFNCDKTGKFYLKLKPNYNIPWQISVEDYY